MRRAGYIGPNKLVNGLFVFLSGKNLVTVNCKNTFEGVFQFSYEWDVGGGGICDNDNSQLVACQEPGSPYVDNEVFTMSFAKCPDVTTSANLRRFIESLT